MHGDSKRIPTESRLFLAEGVIKVTTAADQARIMRHSVENKK